MEARGARGWGEGGSATVGIAALISGLVSWVIYLLSGADTPGWAAAGTLAGVATFSLTMFIRRVPVHREYVAADVAALNRGGAPRSTWCRAARRATATQASPMWTAPLTARRSWKRDAAFWTSLGKPPCPGPTAQLQKDRP